MADQPNQNLTKRRRIELGYFVWALSEDHPGRYEKRYTCKWGGHCERSEPENRLHALHVHEYDSRQAFLRGEAFYDCPGQRP